MALKENLEQIRTNVNDIKGTLYNKYITDENTKLGEVNNKLDVVPIVYTPKLTTNAIGKQYYELASSENSDFGEWNTRKSVVYDVFLNIDDDNIPVMGSQAFGGQYQSGNIPYTLRSIATKTGRLKVIANNRMFINCKNLKSLPLIEFVSNGIYYFNDYEYIFSGCSSLEHINLFGRASSISYMRGTFRNCTALKTISGLDLTSLRSGIATNVFEGCTSLKFIDFSPTENYDNGLSSIYLNNCTAMLGEDLFRTLMTLPQNTKTNEVITIYLSSAQIESLKSLNIVSPYFSNNNIKMYYKQTSSSTYRELNIPYLIMILKGLNISSAS